MNQWDLGSKSTTVYQQKKLSRIVDAKPITDLMSKLQSKSIGRDILLPLNSRSWVKYDWLLTVKKHTYLFPWKIRLQISYLTAVEYVFKQLVLQKKNYTWNIKHINVKLLVISLLKMRTKAYKYKTNCACAKYLRPNVKINLLTCSKNGAKDTSIYQCRKFPYVCYIF